MTQQNIPIPITNSADLAALCLRLSSEPYVTIDTEFMRERTYYPKLCLVQIAGQHEAAAIDALAADLDWSPFWDLLKNTEIIKIFHAHRQDIEIFVNMAGIVPTPLFDTQIAAMACGFPDQVSYARLAETLTGTKINKEEQYTDWTARPLRPAQITYALQDVTVLREAYEALLAKLAESGRLKWVAEEMAVLDNIDYYRVDPETTWERLKLRSNRPSSWAALKLLAAWREREAMHVDRPRQSVMKDDVLSQLALSLPDTAERLIKTRGLPNSLTKDKYVAVFLELFKQAKTAKADAVPVRKAGATLDGTQEDQLELLKLALKIIARQHRIAPKLLAYGDDLENFILDQDANKLRHGWRWDVFGKTAQKLLDGESGIRMEDGKMAITETAS